MIDEAHECLPLKNVSDDLEFWFAKHRHFGHDVVLLTQNEMKIYKNIRDLAELSVKTKKLLLFGFSSHYYRMIYSGPKASGTFFEKIRRKYDPQLCSLYESFTAGGSAYQSNVRPVWLRPKVFIFVGAIFLFIGNFLFSDATIIPGVRSDPQKKSDSKPSQMVKVVQASLPVAPVAPVVQASLPVAKIEPERHFLHGRTVKIVGQLGDMYWLRLDGQLVKSYELEILGYEIFPSNDCRFEAFYKKTLEHIRFSCFGMHVIDPS